MSRAEREREFWDDQVPEFDNVLATYHQGPDWNTVVAMDALEPLVGKQVLDFACGTGITTAWLAARGARVIGIDVAPKALEVGSALCTRLGLEAEFVCDDLLAPADPLPMFEAMFGLYALHHVDVKTFAPALADRLVYGGTGAFVETMQSNPAHMFARRYLVGRLGVPRIGSLDEHPLGTRELDQIREAFGSLSLELGQMKFLRIFDRQLLNFRYSTFSRWVGAVDDWLARFRWLHWLSYHRTVIVRRVPNLAA